MNKKNFEFSSENEHHEKPTKNKIFLGMSFFVICAILCILYIYKLWNNFIAFENNQEDLELISIIYTLYQVGGKWLAICFPVTVLGCCFWIVSKGIQRILKKDYEK